MSRSCLVFFMVSRTPDVPCINCRFFGYLRFNHCRCIAIFVHLLSRSFSLWQVFLCLFAFILSFTQTWTIFSNTLLTSLSAWTVLIHCIIITRVSPLHGLLPSSFQWYHFTMYSCYYRPILFVCGDQEACYRSLPVKKYMNLRFQSYKQ